VGLAQREIEAAGITTVSLSMIPAFTASVGAPRIAAIEYPMGRPFGQPGDGDGQRAVLRAALRVLETARPGEIVHLPFEWPEPPSRVRSAPAEPPPIARLIGRRPWLFMKLLSGLAPSPREVAP
jgi:hypothetical protein